MENNKNKPYTLNPDEPLMLVSDISATQYKVNVDNIKTIKDIKLIFKYLNLHFTPPNKEAFEEIKHLLIIN